MRRLVAIIAACSLLLTGCSIAKVSKPLLRLFVSTCKRDFVRIQAEYLKADCDSLGMSLEYLDIDSDKRKVGHVHNVTDPTLPESRLVNESMIRFMRTF